MSEPQRLERPTVAFYLQDDGTAVFEMIGEDGTEVEMFFDDPEYVYGASVNFERAAVLMARIVRGEDFHTIAQECGGIKLTNDIININDINWEDPK